MVGAMLRFVSLPIRPALSGVAFASMSVQIVPTEQQKEGYRKAAEQLSLFNLPERDPPPVLHPLGGRRLPVERFWFWAGRASKGPWADANFRAANTDTFKSKPVAVDAAAGSA